MSVGLPGSGIGGVFYLLSALWMPVQSTQRYANGAARKRRQAMQQALMAVSIIAMLWLTGAAIEWMLAGAPAHSTLRAAVGNADGDGIPQVLRAASFALTLGTLAFVLLSVQVLRFMLPARRTNAQPENDTRIDRKAA